jgi:protein TonB
MPERKAPHPLDRVRKITEPLTIAPDNRQSTIDNRPLTADRQPLTVDRRQPTADPNQPFTVSSLLLPVFITKFIVMILTYKLNAMNAKKSESVNLENKRTIFMEIGMIIALVLVLCAFNWKSYEKQAYTNYTRSIDNTPVDLAPVTIQKPPEPPQMKKPVVVHTINIVDNESPIDDNYVIDAEIDLMDTMPVYIPLPAMESEEEAPEEEIFTIVESMPEFPGGEAALYAYLQENMTYPRFANEAGISGKVYVTFVVERDGKITDVKLLRGIGGGCDEEALRVIKMMPDWKPGLQRNHPVRVQFILDVKFTLNQM